jgi:hypothetical protein
VTETCDASEIHLSTPMHRVLKRSDGWGKGCNQMDQSGEDMALAHSSPAFPLAYCVTIGP